MIKLLSQRRKEQDGYRPPFTILDEMYEDMIGKYRPAYHAKPPDRVLIVGGVLYKDGERLEYGEQIEPLDDQTMGIQRIQREVDEATPEQMKELTQRYKALAHSLGKPMKDGDCNDQTGEA